MKGISERKKKSKVHSKSFAVSDNVNQTLVFSSGTSFGVSYSSVFIAIGALLGMWFRGISEVIFLW